MWHILNTAGTAKCWKKFGFLEFKDGGIIDGCVTCRGVSLCCNVLKGWPNVYTQPSQMQSLWNIVKAVETFLVYNPKKTFQDSWLIPAWEYFVRFYSTQCSSSSNCREQIFLKFIRIIDISSIHFRLLLIIYYWYFFKSHFRQVF